MQQAKAAKGLALKAKVRLLADVVNVLEKYGRTHRLGNPTQG